MPPPWDAVSPYPGANRVLAPSAEYLISHLLIVPSAKSLRGGKRGRGSVLPAVPAPPPRCPLSLCRFAGRAAASPSLASAECHLTQAARASLSPYQPFCSSHLRGGGGGWGGRDGRERLWGGGDLCARSQPPRNSSPHPRRCRIPYSYKSAPCSLTRPDARGMCVGSGLDPKAHSCAACLSFPSPPTPSRCPHSPLSPSAAAALGGGWGGGGGRALSPPSRTVRAPSSSSAHFPGLSLPADVRSLFPPPPPPFDPPPPPRTAAAVGTSPAASRTGAERCGVGDGKRCGVQPRYAASPPTPPPRPRAARRAERDGIPTCVWGRAAALGPRGRGGGIVEHTRVWDPGAFGIPRIWDAEAFGMLEDLGIRRSWGCFSIPMDLEHLGCWRVWESQGFGMLEGLEILRI